jgi:CBS domain containing-hemolysin-like protein
LGGIALAFLLAFFSLVQSVRVSATGYEIDRLANQRSDLAARRDELIADLNRLGRGPAIRKLAIDLGLDQLAEPLVVAPR